jgi:hypothetical protein
MLPEDAAALVGAGVLSVLFLPSIAVAVQKRARAAMRRVVPVPPAA